MLFLAHISRWIIATFIVLVTLALIYAIKSRSITGITLSLTSLGAGIHFLNVLAKARRESEEEETA